MRVSSTAPLEDNERQLFLTYVRQRNADVDAMTAWVIFSTGMHPWCLANPKKSQLRITTDQGEPYLNWRRAKARTAKQPEMHVPLNPEIQPWLQAFLDAETGLSEFEYFRRVRAFGESIGLEGLSPRTLRHDFCLRMLQACDWDVNDAQALTGTTASILLGYARRRSLRDRREAIRSRGFL